MRVLLGIRLRLGIGIGHRCLILLCLLRCILRILGGIGFYSPRVLLPAVTAVISIAISAIGSCAISHQRSGAFIGTRNRLVMNSPLAI